MDSKMFALKIVFANVEEYFSFFKLVGSDKRELGISNTKAEIFGAKAGLVIQV